MSTAADVITKPWNEKEGPVILTTTGTDGTPNAIYASCVSLYNGNTILVADNYFNKTKQNLLEETKTDKKKTGSVLFTTKDGKAFQLKGDLSYHTDGPLFNNMKQWNPPQHPGHAVAALTINHIYSGGEQLFPKTE